MRRKTEVLNAPDDSRPAPWRPRAVFQIILLVAGSLLFTAVFSPMGALVILRSAPTTILILLAALGLGAAALRVTGLKHLDGAWRMMLALGLGLGVLSLSVLLFGILGFLHRPFWLGLTALGAAGGLIHLWRCISGNGTSTGPHPENLDRWIAMLAIPFAGLAMLAATMPPGTLWPEEANGYDVLEYHLAAPREYLEQGRISYLPHNIYANFPFNVEMLYLLGMILRGGPLQGVFPAQLLHAAFGFLSAIGVWLACRASGRSSPATGALLVATCPFILYLAGLAYVENAMLFFASITLAAFIEGQKQNNRRWFAVSGLMCGLACGCKYTAIPCLLVPLLLSSLIMDRLRPARTAILLACSLATFAPWSLKNLAATGNPVFPLARTVIHEKAGVWSDEAADRWRTGHRPAPGDQSFSRRIQSLKSEVALNPLFGPIVLASVAAMILLGWHRARFGADESTKFLLPVACVFIGTLLTWTFFTHLAGRFAVLLIPPAAILFAGAYEVLARRGLRIAAFILTVTLIAANSYLTARVFEKGKVFDLCSARTTDGLDWFLEGLWPTHAHVPALNTLLSEGRPILAIADARRYYLNRGLTYCVVFNRNPFAEAAASKSPAELIAWLRENRYDFVHVDWTEMKRLRKTYGFWTSIDPSLFERLAAAGLERFTDFTLPGGRIYATLYRVPGTSRPAASKP